MLSVDPNTVYGQNYYKGIGFVSALIVLASWSTCFYVLRLMARYDDYCYRQRRQAQADECVRHLKLFDARIRNMPWAGYQTSSKWDTLDARKFGFTRHFFFNSAGALPQFGDSKTAYTNLDTDVTYSWTGTAYCEIVFKV